MDLSISHIVGALLAWFSVPRRPSLALVGLSLPLVAFPIVAGPVLETVATDRSARDLAEAVRSQIASGAEPLWVESFAGGLSFYLERAIPVATVEGDELRSNYILRNHDRFLRESDLLIPLGEASAAVDECGTPRVFLLGRGRPDLADLISETRPAIPTGSRRWSAYGPECLLPDDDEVPE